MKTTLITSIFALSLVLAPTAQPNTIQDAQQASIKPHNTQVASSCTKGCLADGEAQQVGSQFATRGNATPINQQFASTCSKGCFAEGDTGEIAAVA